MPAAAPDPSVRLPSIAFVGAGRVALSLTLALQRGGVAVAAIGSRRLATARQWVARLPSGPQPAACEAVQAVAEADLVFLTVPDDAIASTAASLPWRPGQGVVHCSGATELAALAPAARRGARVGGFHPLQIFSDPVVAAERLAGCCVAIEAPPGLNEVLVALAGRLGLHPLPLPEGARVRYHAAAGYAASSLLPLLQEAADLWRSFGLDEADCLRALLPLARGTLDAVAARGVAGALSGPVSRGDAAVLLRQREALQALGAQHERLFVELGRRQLALARTCGRLPDEALQSLHNVFDPTHEPKP